jgi:hypothetical protein
MEKNNQWVKGWLVTLAYKENEVWDDNRLELHLQQLKHIQFYAFQLEKSNNTELLHHQIYLYFEKRVSFNLIKDHLPKAHIEARKGTHKQALEYVTKNDTRANPTRTWGDEPQQGERTDLADIIEMIEQGHNLEQIMLVHPANYLRYRNNIEHALQNYKERKVENQFRNLTVTYVYGKTGVGKTSTIMKHYGFNKVYRVTDYKHPFDTYQGQEIIIFDEFHSQIKIESMLNLLDGYPLRLPARYNDKVAQYTKVYIISNVTLDKQYPNIQKYSKDTYDALMRRINYQFDINQLKVSYDLPF